MRHRDKGPLPYAAHQSVLPVAFTAGSALPPTVFRQDNLSRTVFIGAAFFLPQRGFT
jgi:hypothetical protein